MTDAQPASSPGSLRVVLAAVSIGTLMATLDASALNVAMPTIARDFGVGIGAISWISLIYFLVITSSLLTVGRLSDLGRRSTAFSWGMGLFALASGACALSPSLGVLVAARGLQAVAGALIMANSPALLAAAFPGNRRGRALGAISLVSTVGSSLGPAVGGLLTATMGWHGIFWVNLPIGLFGMVVGLRVLGRIPQAPAASRAFDPRGALLSAASMAATLLALREGARLGAPAAWALGALGVLGLGAFVWHETRHPAPLVAPRLFANRIFASATGASFLSFFSRAGAFLLLPFFLERSQGYSPAAVGFMMTSFPVAVALVAPLSGALSDRLGTRGLTVAGQLLGSLALAMMACAQPGWPVWLVLASHSLLGVGAGLFSPPNNNAMLGAVERDQLGMASGMLAVMRNLGLTLGTGVCSLILAGRSGDFQGAYRLALGLSALVALVSALVASTRSEGKALAVRSAS